MKTPLGDVQDGICHVMRAFEDDDVIHAEDTVDPAPYPNELRQRASSCQWRSGYIDSGERVETA